MFVGRLHPLGIVLASLLMALLYLGGEAVQTSLQLPQALAGVFQGLLLFCLLGCDLFVNYRVRRRVRRASRASTFLIFRGAHKMDINQASTSRRAPSSPRFR